MIGIENILAMFVDQCSCDQFNTTINTASMPINAKLISNTYPFKSYYGAYLLSTSNDHIQH